jgi:hypothetical protein
VFTCVKHLTYGLDTPRSALFSCRARPTYLGAALGLGAAGPDPADPDRVEGAPDLGAGGPATELLGERLAAVGVLDEDAVEVRVQGEGEAVPGDRLAENLEVPGGVLGEPEGPAGDDPRRVVDAGDEGEVWAPPLEPVMAAPVGLEEHPRPRHPLAPASVGRRSPGPRGPDPRRTEDPPDGPRGGRAGIGLGEVDGVEARVRRPGELGDRCPRRLVDAVRRLAPAVAVDQAGGSLGPQPIGKALDLPDRQAQVCRGVRDGQLAGEDMGQDQEALLRLGIQRDCLPRLHGIEGDKVAVPLAPTESLAADSWRQAC